MSIIRKILTAIRGGSREMGEAVVDKNSIRIFEQEIKDAEQALKRAKQDLTVIIAQEMQANRKIIDLNKNIEEYTAYIEKALNKDDEALALEIATKIAEFKVELTTLHNTQSTFDNHANRLKEMIKQTSKALADMQQELLLVKSTQRAQKAAINITQNYATGSSKLLKAKESLDRIKSQQQDLNDRLIAGDVIYDEFNNHTLEKKLKDSGIIKAQDSAYDILNSVKTKLDNKTND